MLRVSSVPTGSCPWLSISTSVAAHQPEISMLFGSVVVGCEYISTAVTTWKCWLEGYHEAIPSITVVPLHGAFFRPGSYPSCSRSQLLTMAFMILAASVLAGLTCASVLPSHDVQVSYGTRSAHDFGRLSPRGIEARSDHNKTFDIGWQVQEQPLFSALDCLRPM